jgi:hypothetical protein
MRQSAYSALQTKREHEYFLFEELTLANDHFRPADSDVIIRLDRVIQYVAAVRPGCTLAGLLGRHSSQVKPGDDSY